ncbi:MAG: relaxase MobL [Firmicutes bacterium]|nr:relaxase MobL [Bacillota bacterium]
MSAPNVVLRFAYAPHEDSQITPSLREKYGEKRKFYSCRGKSNYVSYVNDGSKQKIDYVSYTGNKEKSHGVYDSDGQLDKEQQTELRKKLRASKSVIWHGVISFTTEFGNKYMTDNADALRLMNKELPKLFKSAGLKAENITWYAGLHENTFNKHIHFSFFENEPLRYTARKNNEPQFSNGLINKNILTRFKINIERCLTDITGELKLARKGVTSIAKNVLFSTGNMKRNLTAIQEKMLKLVTLLPAEGHLSYASENMTALRPRINCITDLLIKSDKKLYNAFNVFCNAAVIHDERTKKILISQKVDEKYWEKYLTADKVLDDVYKRLGNYIINTARVFKNKQKATKSNAIRKRVKKQMTAGMLTHCLKMGVLIEREAMTAFSEYLAKLKEAEMNNIGSDKQKERDEIEME